VQERGNVAKGDTGFLHHEVGEIAKKDSFYARKIVETGM
jgi:hypothetical protein